MIMQMADVLTVIRMNLNHIVRVDGMRSMESLRNNNVTASKK